MQSHRASLRSGKVRSAFSVIRFAAAFLLLSVFLALPAFAGDISISLTAHEYSTLSGVTFSAYRVGDVENNEPVLTGSFSEESIPETAGALEELTERISKTVASDAKSASSGQTNENGSVTLSVDDGVYLIRATNTKKYGTIKESLVWLPCFSVLSSGVKDVVNNISLVPKATPRVPAPVATISKVAITGGEELPGATLQIKDSSGNVVEEWVSGNEPHKVTLALGTYTLVEITAPNGYQVAESITFTMTDTDEVTKIEMVDAPIETETPTPETPSPEIPQTQKVTEPETEPEIPMEEESETETKPSGLHGDGKTDETKEPTVDITVPPTVPPTQVTTSSGLITGKVATGDFFRYLPAIMSIGGGVLLIALLVIFKRKKK